MLAAERISTIFQVFGTRRSVETEPAGNVDVGEEVTDLVRDGRGKLLVVQ